MKLDESHLIGAFGSKTPLWFPELTAGLAERQWAILDRDIGLSPSTYGTARVKRRSIEAEFDLAGQIDLPDGFRRPSPLAIEILRKEVARPYRELGLALADEGYARAPFVQGSLRSALSRFDPLPDLAVTLGLLIHSLHVVSPDGPDYDVSYSDPEVPFSIFVGVPDQPGRNTALRLAEGVLHEAMHLQLSLIEDLTLLVQSTEERHYSPWQRKLRPPQGILHGLYVFAVIRDVMTKLLDIGVLDGSDRQHAMQRAADCDREIEMASTDLAAGRSLTPPGVMLLDRLRRRTK